MTLQSYAATQCITAYITDRYSAVLSGVNPEMVSSRPKNNPNQFFVILFNDALNTFYSWLYGIRHMVKDHTDSERGNHNIKKIS